MTSEDQCSGFPRKRKFPNFTVLGGHHVPPSLCLELFLLCNVSDQKIKIFRCQGSSRGSVCSSAPIDTSLELLSGYSNLWSPESLARHVTGFDPKSKAAVARKFCVLQAKDFGK